MSGDYDDPAWGPVSTPARGSIHADPPACAGCAAKNEELAWLRQLVAGLTGSPTDPETGQKSIFARAAENAAVARETEEADAQPTPGAVPQSDMMAAVRHCEQPDYEITPPQPEESDAG